jgi:uncharacterized protein YjbI with pentapeptide repeats
MANYEALKRLTNPEVFLNHLRSAHHTVDDLDFSGEEINFDFSGLNLVKANFANCKLQGSCFSNSYLGSSLIGVV